MSRLFSAATLAALLLGSQSHAHHSFAVHYDSNKVITKEGVATEFRFANPHGILMLDVTNESGEVEQWTVETTSPSYMRRFGWTPDMIKPGDRLIVEGWASRDGSHLMRIRSVMRPDGTQIGRPNQAGDE
jgi:hypothetical protein